MTPGNNPEAFIHNDNHGESLQSHILTNCLHPYLALWSLTWRQHVVPKFLYPTSFARCHKPEYGSLNTHFPGNSCYHNFRRICLIAKIGLLDSPCPSVRLFACISSALTGLLLVKFYIGVLFQKSVEKIQIRIKSGKNIGHFTWRPKNVLL